MISKANFKKHVKSITLPEGFTSKFETENLWKDEKQEVFVIKADKIEMRFEQSGCGHTNFLIGDTWCSFDRRGVEDSFYHLPMWDDDDTPDLNEIITDQLERIKLAISNHAEAIEVPGIPFTVSPSRYAALKKSLKAKGGRADFMPSGFGSGYTITNRSVAGSKRASAETEKFFEISPLFISKFDAD